MPAIQTYLPLNAELRLPMLSVAGARCVLGLHENLIKEQCDLGSIIAWDISRAGAKRRELRLLAASVRAWPAGSAYTEADLVKLVYNLRPGELRAYIYGSWFCRAWNCDSGHMINLVTDKTLTLMPQTSYGRGRGNTPCITWDSAVNFLRDRRIR